MKLIRLVVVICLGGLVPSAAVAQTIVWTDVNALRIQGKDVNGGQVQTFVQFQSPQGAGQIHYDPITAKLYYRWGSFHRSNLDGSDPETIPTPSVGAFTLNVELRKLYWIESPPHNVLHRSDLNGSGVESHTYLCCAIFALEAVGSDLFFGAGGDNKGVWRADADGSNEQFLHESGQPTDLAYDPVENKLYLASIADIQRLNPDGSGVQQVHQGDAEQVVVDARGRKLYWANGDAQGFQRIQRSNLDGSNVEDFVTVSDVGDPDFDIGGLTIVYNSTPIPTMSGWGLAAMTVLILGTGLLVLRKHFNTYDSDTHPMPHKSLGYLAQLLMIR